MSVGSYVWDESFTAFGDMRSTQYCFVEIKAADTVQKTSAAAAVAMGVLQNNPNSGQQAQVRLLGKSLVVAAGTITAGALVGTDANGYADSKTAGSDTTEYVIGQALETFASGDIRSILVRGTPLRAA